MRFTLIQLIPIMKWVLPFALLLLTSCGDDHDMADVTVSFRHVVEESPLVLNQVDYGNEVGESYNVTRLEYILTDIVLMRDDGTSVNLRDVFYVRVPENETGDGADETTRFLTRRIPGGSYSAVSFRFGVPAGAAFGDLPNEVNLNQMEWPVPMGGGYHYMRLEGLVEGGAEPLLAHLGPSRGGDFSFVVELPINLFVDGEHTQVQITMNVDRWWQPNIYTFTGRGMIMGNPQVQTLLSDNGPGVFSAASIP